MSSYRNVTKVTYPDSYYVERVFDEINRLTGIKLNGATALALEFEYDKLSRRTKLTYENGVETDYGFQLDNDMESLIQTFTGSSVEFSYGFNSVHELTSQSVDDSAYMWHPASGGTVTYGSANSMNQYPTVAGNSISYDDNGCLTDDGTFAFTYDTENQLIEADDGSTVSSYIYDPMRRQNQKDVGGTKTRYLYDGLQMIAEYDGSGTLQKKYVYGTGLDEALIELDSSNNKTYLHHDRKGSIVATSNSSGAVINSYAYSPFGESGSLSGTTFGYTGQRFDPETGLYYYKNRHYSPELGRFLQPDLIGYGDGLNVYQYGYNDPNMFSDPIGLAADGSRLGSDTGGVMKYPAGVFGGGFVPGTEGTSSVGFANQVKTIPGPIWSPPNKEIVIDYPARNGVPSLAYLGGQYILVLDVYIDRPNDTVSAWQELVTARNKWKGYNPSARVLNTNAFTNQLVASDFWFPLFVDAQSIGETDYVDNLSYPVNYGIVYAYMPENFAGPVDTRIDVRVNLANHSTQGRTASINRDANDFKSIANSMAASEGFKSKNFVNQFVQFLRNGI